MPTSTYIKLLPSGNYEYGVIVYGKDRRKDKLIPQGTAKTYEVAARLAAAL